MMSWDLLLHWMSHLGQGSWDQFRRTVTELAPSDADVPGLCRSLRLRLSDLGHADFFIKGSSRWLVLRPMLCGLAFRPNTYLFCGGRTPALTEALSEAASRHGCLMHVEQGLEQPDVISITGHGADVETCAETCGIDLVPNAGATLAGSLLRIAVVIEQAKEAAAPVNWSPRSFDLTTMRWVDGKIRGSAIEYSARYGSPRYFLLRRRGRLLELPKREAVYASAMIRRVPLIHYDEVGRALSTPAAAPLPETYARAAALCAGAVPQSLDGCLVYSDVPIDAAALLLVSAGQPHPACSGFYRSQEAIHG